MFQTENASHTKTLCASHFVLQFQHRALEFEGILSEERERHTESEITKVLRCSQRKFHC